MQQTYQKLFENNKKWVAERIAGDPNYFEKLAGGQAPRYLFIGCSDSRVPANEITGTEAGEMFVHRNIANLVVHTDMNFMSVLQYAVEVLKVEHIIVCGHYGCGGVKASTDHTYHGLVDKWLRNITDVYRMYRQELDLIQDEKKRLDRLVELNVREQVYNLSMTSTVQKAWMDKHEVQIHGWVYDISNGYLIDLDIDIEKDFKDFGLYRYNSKAARH
jgi:carbonic anhydrase